MTRDEAKYFYRVKLNRARKQEHIDAYEAVLDAVWFAHDIKAEVTRFAEQSPIAARRAIYRKVIRELDI